MNALLKATLGITASAATLFGAVLIGAIPATAKTCILPGNAGSTVECQSCDDPGCHLIVYHGGSPVASGASFHANVGTPTWTSRPVWLNSGAPFIPMPRR